MTSGGGGKEEEGTCSVREKLAHAPQERGVRSEGECRPTRVPCADRHGKCIVVSAVALVVWVKHRRQNPRGR